MGAGRPGYGRAAARRAAGLAAPPGGPSGRWQPRFVLPAAGRGCDLPGRVGAADPCGHQGADIMAQLPPGGAPALLPTRDEAACGDDQAGDVLGHFAGNLLQDRCAGAGGEHDAGVPEHALDDFQVGSGSQSKAGGAVAEVVQADRRHAAGLG